jgi:hypothetical protein
MPRFFFHLHDDDALAVDEEGIDIAAKEVPVRALRALRDIAAHEAGAGRLNLSHRLEVRDEAGRTVHTLTSREAVTVIGVA